MKIAIVGIGVAGSYLLSRLSNEHKVIGIERLRLEEYYPPCAWATSSIWMKDFMKNVGLNFDDYILHRGKEMCIDLRDRKIWVKLKGLCTFDKLRLEIDMIKGYDVIFGRRIVDAKQLEGYDLILDCTGFLRSLLPPLRKDYIIQTLEYKVKYSSLPYDDFYIRPMRAGYLWFFPLGDGYAHVGCGDYYGNHRAVLDSFMKEHPGEILKRIGRPVRITPPPMCKPYFQGNVIGVGESIGTVYSVLGEGIIPSLQCAELLVKNIHDPEAYANDVMRFFMPYQHVFMLVSDKIHGRFSALRDFGKLLRVFEYMKFNEDRFGLTIRLMDILRIFFSKATSTKH